MEPRLQPHIEGEWHPYLHPISIETNHSLPDTIASTPPFRPSQLVSAYMDSARIHQDVISRTTSSIHLQYESLGIASRNLDIHVLSMSEAFEDFDAGARAELEKQEMLLNALEIDLELIAKVKIHPEFLTPSVRRAVEAGETERTLGNYVSNDKMRSVAEGCLKMHGRFVIS